MQIRKKINKHIIYIKDINNISKDDLTYIYYARLLIIKTFIPIFVKK